MLLSLSEAIEQWNTRSSNDDEVILFDIMAVVTFRCDASIHSDKNGRYRRLGLADSQARAVFRLSDSVSSFSVPIEGSVITLYGVSMKKAIHEEVELRQDGRKHEGPLWQVLLPYNATGEQRQQNQQAASLWSWWHQRKLNVLTQPKCVDRTLGELSLTAGLKGNIVAYVCQVHAIHPKRLHKRKAFLSTRTPHVTALLADAAHKTFISLLDKTGLLLRKLERAQQTQELVRISSVKSAIGSAEEIMLSTTHETHIHPVVDTNTAHCYTPDSQALPQRPFSPPPETRVVISPLHRVNKCRTVQHLPPGQKVHLDIATESVVATYSTVFEVLSCGGDLLILQALMDEAIPLRWTICANGAVSQVSLVGFPLNTITS